MFKSNASKKSKGSRGSDRHSWKMSISRRSVGSVHSSFSLHTRLANVLAEDQQDAFDPNSTAIKLWGHILLLSLLLESFLLPYLLAFQPATVGSVSMFYALIIACEGVFAVDFYIQAHTGYYSDGNLIRDKKRTIRRYVRSFQFILDIVAILPYQALVVRYPQVVAKLLFLKFLRWSRLPDFVSILDEFYTKHFVALKLFKVVASTLYLAHVLACVRYSFGSDESHSNPWLPEHSSSHHAPHVDYLMSLFWSVGIMTGLFEGELPHHSMEFLFTTLVALCGFSMFTTLVATIFVISKCESGHAEAMEARISQLRYYTDAESYDREAAKMLCPSIANDIQVELLKSTIAKVSLFDGCSDQFIVAVTSLLKMIAVPAHTTLFSAGDYGDAMYVVQSGVLTIIVDSVTVREIRKGSCFGELSIFSSMPRTATVISTTFSLLYRLSRFHCERVLEGYPKCAAVISGHVEDVLNQLTSCEKDANDTSTSVGTSSTGTSSKGDHHRVSIAAGCIDGVSTLRKNLSKRGAQALCRRTRSVKKGAVTPLQPNISMRRSVREANAGMSIPRSVREGSGRISVPSSMPDTDNGTEYVTSTANEDASLLSNSILASGRQLRKRMLNTYDHRHGKAKTTVYQHHGLWRLILLSKCIDHHSRTRKWWLLLHCTNQLYCWTLIPIQVVFPLWQQPSWMALTVDTISNACLLLDIALNLNLSFMVDSEKIMDPKRSAQRYLKGSFFFDLLCSFPYEYFYMKRYGIMRLPRLLRIFHLSDLLNEMEHFIHLNSKHQLVLFGVLLFIMFHIVTCVHFSISYIEGFNPSVEEAWISSIKVCLRRLNATNLEDCNGKIFDVKDDRAELLAITLLEYFRSLYYAVGVLASPGKSVEPTTDVQLVAALVLMLSGFLITGIVVDNVQKRFTASAFEQKEFFATRMFFLLEGEVCIVKMDGSPREIPRGNFFGTAVLTQQERGEGYMEHVSASSGCILLFVSRAQLQAMQAIFPKLKTELLALEQRLLSNKLAKMHMETKRDLYARRGSAPQLLQSALTGLKGSLTSVHDPDSLFILAWETWVFLVLTAQWVLVMFQVCFFLEGGHKNADALMVFLEVSFVLDMYIRSRLGFYEYGNKMMDLQRIKRAYFRSGTFALDIAALLPLYVVNWCVPADKRWDMLNINKLLRLFKVPRQLYALETRFLKRTTELRLFKLLYYTFMLSHVFGCIWFNFASKVAVPTFSSSGNLPVTKKTAFGDNHWLPSEHLEHGSHILQYMASLYWSFGLMSASSEPEFPKTTAQCAFSVVTMTTGFFLFAYVIGNFTDIIELTTSESREFDAKMGAVRQMLDHFRMSDPLQERIKTFLLFKRFHSITQERILVHCLPPSLLTDIRLVHLKPMIEKVEFLRGMEGSITRMMVSQFTQVLVSRGEYVCKFDENGSDMFFIFTGVLDVLLPIRAPGSTKPSFKSIMEGLNRKKIHARIATSRASEKKSKVTPNNTQYQEQLRKVNEISAGSYFGENGLFTNAQRNAYIQAQTSCILYRLSRESLETVFDRYPEWKRKVLRIAGIHREQIRLLQLSRDEQRRRTTTSNGVIVSGADIMNERAERLKEKIFSSRLQRSKSVHINLIKASSQRGIQLLDESVVKPSLKIFDALLRGVPVQSKFHLFWLRFIVCCTMYVAVMVPYQLAMDPMDRITIPTSIAKVIGLQCEVAFIVDIWFSWHIQESPAAMELYDQNLRSMYKNDRMVLDIIAAIPFYGFLTAFKCGSWVKLLRCVKIFNVMSYLNELNRRSVSSEITRFWHVWMLYLLVIYWAACAYLAVAMQVGFGTEWEGWLPSQELEISDPDDPSTTQLVRRFLRGLFFATTAFVKKARNLAPETAPLYAFQIAASFVGLITISFVIGELASLFISYIGLEVDFRKNHIAVELYLIRLRVSDRLKMRAYAFMTSLWSSHAGVNYEALLSEMPDSIRSACVIHTAKEPLDWFVSKVIAPICWEGNESVVAFTLSLAQRLQFECYPRDENVVMEGSIVRAMYFVIKGHLRMQSRSLLAHPVGLRDGSYFGERGILGCTISAYTVRTVRACDLVSLSSEAFAQVLQDHPFSRLALQICASAHRYLKAHCRVPCSRIEMEDHWGEALLHSVNEFKSKHEASLANDGVDSTAQAIDAPRSATTDAEAAAEGCTEANDDNTARLATFLQGYSSTEADFLPREEVCGDTRTDLPTRLHEMFGALDTTSTCYESFAALLHSMLATDPLDWGATFAASANADLAGTLATLSASSKSAHYCRRLSAIDASFNTNNEPVAVAHAPPEEQLDEAIDASAAKEQQSRDAVVAAGPSLEDAMAAAAEGEQQAMHLRRRQLPQLQLAPVGPHVQDL
ncbi:unnamed protein product [Phytophthora fragariaefolia]|uniref:Unnamed protein product n=1 Tax=Phytophthora fragariaefolia TaxID=1490495 RepID=A0A9W7D3P3_9STRA|nr:unnamed protein product [Phytophthora fragariaefolia]